MVARCLPGWSPYGVAGPVPCFVTFVGNVSHRQARPLGMLTDDDRDTLLALAVTMLAELYARHPGRDPDTLLAARVLAEQARRAVEGTPTPANA